jgi:hypothetical protein
MANELIGLDIGIKLDGFRAEMAKIPGITAENAKAMAAALNKSIKEAERAAKAAAAATKAQAEAAKRAEQNTRSFGEAAGSAGAAAGKLGGALGAVSPAAGEVARTMADAADMMEVAAQAFAAAPGPTAVAAAAIAALGAAYQIASREAERVAAAATFAREQHEALVPSTRALEDAQLDLAVAMGQVSAAQADQMRTAQAAQRAVIDFAASQAAQRAEIGASIESAQRWTDAITTFIPAQYNLAYQAADAVMGWSSAIEDGNNKLAALDQTAQKNAQNVKASREATQRAAEAQELLNWANEKGEAPARGVAKATAEAAAQNDTAAASAQAYQGALQRMAAEQVRAEQTGANAFDRLHQQREDAIARVVEAEKAAVEAAMGNDEALEEAYAASAAARLAIDEAFEAERDTLLAQYSAQQEERAAAAHAQALARAQQQREAIVGAATSMMGSLSELASIKAQDTSKKDAERARRQFRVSKGLAIAEAMVNAGVATVRAFKDYPFPASAAIAIAAGVAATANVARIRAIEPAFHVGGMASDLAPDEVRTTRLTRGEGVLTARGVDSIGGPDAVRRANAGGGQQSPIVVPVLMGNGAPTRLLREALLDPAAQAAVQRGAQTNLRPRY